MDYTYIIYYTSQVKLLSTYISTVIVLSNAVQLIVIHYVSSVWHGLLFVCKTDICAPPSEAIFSVGNNWYGLRQLLAPCQLFLTLKTASDDGIKMSVLHTNSWPQSNSLANNNSTVDPWPWKPKEFFTVKYCLFIFIILVKIWSFMMRSWV